MLSILLAGIGGGLGAGFGYLISRCFSNRFSSQKAKAIVIVIPVILFGQLGSRLADNQNIQDIISPPSRVEKLSRTKLKMLVENPKFKNAISQMTAEQRHPYIQQLTKRGLKRLTFQELKTWNSLRIKMAKSSQLLGAGFWTGEINPKELAANLERLGDQDLSAWVDTIMAAAVSELEEKPFAPSPDPALQEGIELISSRLNPDEKARMAKVLESGVKANPADACWVMLILLEGVESFSQPQQEVFLRSLASL
jgi:hypothetical protein